MAYITMKELLELYKNASLFVYPGHDPVSPDSIF